MDKARARGIYKKGKYLYYAVYRIKREHTHTHTSESIVIRPPEVLGNRVEGRNSFASYTAHLKNAPSDLGWHCLSHTFHTQRCRKLVQ